MNDELTLQRFRDALEGGVWFQRTDGHRVTFKTQHQQKNTPVPEFRLHGQRYATDIDTTTGGRFTFFLQ